MSDYRTKAEIMPLTIIDKVDSRVKDREIIKAHRRLYMRNLEEYKSKFGGKLPRVGSIQIYVDGASMANQYVALASLAKYLGKTFYMGWNCDDLGHLPFKMTTEMDRNTGNKVSYLCKENDEDSYILFKNFRFPIVGQGVYKLDLWKWFDLNGYTQVRSKTHFCQDPVIHPDGTCEPCGMCAPCVMVVKSKVLEPFTKKGLARYKDYEENYERESDRFIIMSRRVFILPA